MPWWRCQNRSFVIRLLRVEVHDSARKHGVHDEDITHAVARGLVEYDLDDDDSPSRRLVLASDRAGNLLDVVVVTFDDGDEMVIHAMPMRSTYHALIDEFPEGSDDD